MSKLKANIAVISLFPLVMLIAGSIDSIRNLPTTALFGSNLPFFFGIATLFFLLPVALITAELAANWPKARGVYHWVDKGLGNNFAFLAIWLQWVNTVIWYPTILSFIAGTCAYFVNPALAQNKYYLITFIISLYLILTVVNLRGLKTSSRLASSMTVIGLVIPMGIIILFGLLWVGLGHPSQVHFTLHNLIPDFSQQQNWLSLTAILTSFVGLELAMVHIREVKNPQRTFPVALAIATVFILGTMLFGSLAIAIVLPANSIHLVDGTIQAFQQFLLSYHLGFALPLLVMMLVIGSIGSLINWLISPAKGLQLAAESGYLPKFLAHQNQHFVAKNILILQACVVLVLCSIFLFMPSVNGSYWLLSDLSTELYLLMYFLMFVAAWRVSAKTAKQKGSFKIPGGVLGTRIVCLIGMIGCSLSLIVGFMPPTDIEVGSAKHYDFMFSTILILALTPAVLACGIRAFLKKKTIFSVSSLS